MYKGVFDLAEQENLDFYGNLQVIPSIWIRNGWTIYVEFNQPITNFESWTAFVRHKSPDSTSFVLENKIFNRMLWPNSALKVDVSGSKSANFEVKAFVRLSAGTAGDVENCGYTDHFMLKKSG